MYSSFNSIPDVSINSLVFQNKDKLIGLKLTLGVWCFTLLVQFEKQNNSMLNSYGKKK